MTANPAATILLTRSTTPSALLLWAGNPVDLNLTFGASPAAGNTFEGADLLRLEIHPDRFIDPARTPLALLEYESPTGTTQTATFTGAQLNLCPEGVPEIKLWLHIYTTYPDGAGPQNLQLIALTLRAHPAALLAGPPPDVPVSATALTKGQADALYHRTGTVEPLADVPLLDGTAHAADQIDSRIAGLTASDTTKKIFTTENHIAGTYVRSTTCWARDINLTGLGVARQTSGTWYTTLGFAAITARHVVMCHHAIIPDGSTLRFVTATGVVVDRTLSSSVQIGSTDIRVGTLAADLPSTIKPMPLLPSDFESVAGPDGLLLLTTDQQLKANVHEVSSWGNIGQPETAKALEFYEAGASGDSGHAWLVLREGSPYLFSFFTGTSSGELLHRFASSMASAAPAASFPAWRGGPHWDAVRNKPAFGNAALLTASATPTNGQLPLVGSGGKLPLAVIPDNPDNGTMPVGQVAFDLVVGSNQISMGNLGNGLALTGILAAGDLIAGDDSVTYDGDTYTWNGTFWEDGNFDLADPLILSDTTLTLSTNAARTINLLVPSYNSANTGAADVRVVDLPLFPASESVREATLVNLGISGGGGGGGANLSYTASSTQGVVTSDSGTDATLPAATTSNAGLLLPADKIKLNNLSGTNTGDQDLSGYATTSALTSGLAGKEPAGAAATAQAYAIQRANHTGTQAISTITDLASTIAAKADLVGGVIPTAQIPAIAISEFLGTSANEAAMLAKTGQKGDWTNRTDLGQAWIITGTDPTQLTDWTALTYPAAPVTSVNGITGAVTISTITGNAGTATALATTRSFSITGDASWTVNFNGSADVTAALTLANTTVTPGSYTNASITVDSKGRITAASTGAIPVLIIIALSDESTALTAGANKVVFRAPFAFTLTAVRASVNTAPTGSTLIVDINESGTSVLSTKLSIDASEKTSTTAASAAVISDSSIADDAEISFDIDQIGSSVAGAGLKVTLIGTR